MSGCQAVHASDLLVSGIDDQSPCFLTGERVCIKFTQVPGQPDGTASRKYMGPLPATGQWVRLEVPASTVDLESKTLYGMAFTLVNGKATWDRTGKTSGTK